MRWATGQNKKKQIFPLNYRSNLKIKKPQETEGNQEIHFLTRLRIPPMNMNDQVKHG